MDELARLAREGDRESLDILRKFLFSPGMAEAYGGDVAWRAVTDNVLRNVGSNLAEREATYIRIEALRSELAGPNPTVVESLLIERVVATWLHLNYLEQNYAMDQDPELDRQGHFQKALSAAQKRHLAAMKALTDVRRLALPAVQINVAREQVNVAGGSVPAAARAEVKEVPRVLPAPPG